MVNPLVYQPTPIPKGCDFRISPSSFANFITAPHNWFRKEILKIDAFSHNTLSVVGTIVHYIAEQVALDKPVNVDVIEEYIDMLTEHNEYDKEEVRKQYPVIAKALINEYVLNRDFLYVEKALSIDIGKGVAVAGMLDRLEGSMSKKEIYDSMVVDYKTYRSKRKPQEIPSYYKYQLLVYAWMAKQKKMNPTRIRLVYVNHNIEGEISEKTGKRLKSYPPEVTVLTEVITQEDLDFIESQIMLCRDTLELSKKQPELNYIIWHDPRLKEV